MHCKNMQLNFYWIGYFKAQTLSLGFNFIAFTEAHVKRCTMFNDLNSVEAEHINHPTTQLYQKRNDTESILVQFLNICW